MEVRNRWGTAVDPVPFAVVAATAFTVCYSFGPGYLLTFDVDLPVALLVTTGVYLALTVGAYYRLVWTFRPEYREEVPVGVRFRRLVLGAAVTLGVLVLFALPLFAG
jgi:hypothetical protein